MAPGASTDHERRDSGTAATKTKHVAAFYGTREPTNWGEREKKQTLGALKLSMYFSPVMARRVRQAK